jgi:hypothetical protein
MVFGSNTSASSWEPIRRAIEALIIKYSTRSDLIKRHKDILDILIWKDDNTWTRDLVQAVECPLNPRIPDLDGNLEAYIYVDDIMASAVNKHNILRLLAAIIKATFTVCDRPNIKLCQCSLSLEKWEELVLAANVADILATCRNNTKFCSNFGQMGRCCQHKIEDVGTFCIGLSRHPYFPQKTRPAQVCM